MAAIDCPWNDGRVDVPGLGDLTRLAAAERAAERSLAETAEAFDHALDDIRSGTDAPSWQEISAATGHSVQALRWRLRRAGDGYRPPSVAQRARAGGRSRAKADPEAGLSLAVAAERLGLSRQGLRNRVAVAAEHAGERVRLEVAGVPVEVQAATDPGLPWRVWILS